MSKHFLSVLWFCAAISACFVQAVHAKNIYQSVAGASTYKVDHRVHIDSASNRVTIIDMINTVVKASGDFDIDAVANLYTPNAVIADEEPPFSWNGPTAGVQWINTVQKTCKDYKLKDFKGKVGRINVYLQTDESIYVVVPVDYTGQIRGDRFEEDGAFTFVFRVVNGHWLIKSQVWVARKGM